MIWNVNLDLLVKLKYNNIKKLIYFLNTLNYWTFTHFRMIIFYVGLFSYKLVKLHILNNYIFKQWIS